MSDSSASGTDFETALYAASTEVGILQEACQKLEQNVESLVREKCALEKRLIEQDKAGRLQLLDMERQSAEVIKKILVKKSDVEQTLARDNVELEFAVNERQMLTDELENAMLHQYELEQELSDTKAELEQSIASNVAADAAEAKNERMEATIDRLEQTVEQLQTDAKRLLTAVKESMDVCLESATLYDEREQILASIRQQRHDALLRAAEAEGRYHQLLQRTATSPRSKRPTETKVPDHYREDVARLEQQVLDLQKENTRCLGLLEQAHIVVAHETNSRRRAENDADTFRAELTVLHRQRLQPPNIADQKHNIGYDEHPSAVVPFNHRKSNSARGRFRLKSEQQQHFKSAGEVAAFMDSKPAKIEQPTIVISD